MTDENAIMVAQQNGNVRDRPGSVTSYGSTFSRTKRQNSRRYYKRPDTRTANMISSYSVPTLSSADLQNNQNGSRSTFYRSLEISDDGHSSRNDQSSCESSGVTLCRSVSIEVVIFFYFITVSTIGPVIQLYLIERTATDHPDYSRSEILDRVSDVVMYSSFCGNFVAIVTTHVIGRLSDRFGRRFAVLSGLFGILLKTGCWIIVTHLKLKVEYIYIGSALEGLFGSYATFLMGIYGSVADITDSAYGRKLRITIAEATTFTAVCAGTTASGFWFKYLGSEIAFVFGASASAVAILIALIFLPETLRPENATPLSMESVKKTAAIFFSEDPPARRPILLLGILVFFCGNFLLQASQITTVLYLQGGSFEWESTKITVYSGVYILSSWIAIVALTTLIGRRTSDMSFIMLGCVSTVAGFLLQGLAGDSTTMYIAAVAGLFGNFVVPISRTILSKSVPAGDQGALFAGLGVVEMAATTVGGLAAPALFKLGLRVYYGIHALVYSGISVFIFLVTIVLRVYISKRNALTMDSTSITVNYQHLETS